MCKLCGHEEHVIDDNKTSLNVIKTIDEMIISLKQPVLSKKSQSSKWEDKPNDNPFIDHARITKRGKKYGKELSKIFKGRKSQFKENLSAKQNPISILFGNLFGIKRAELTEDEWKAILSGVVDKEQLSASMVGMFVDQELEISFDEVLQNTIDEFKLDVNPKSKYVPTNIIEEYKNFNLKLGDKMGQNFSDKIQSIVTYGIEDGKSTRDIGKEISDKFDFYTKKEAERIARTETIRASSRGALSSYEALGIEYYELLPALDACPICIDRASQGPFKITDTYGRSPIHPSCRCAVLPVI